MDNFVGEYVICSTLIDTSANSMPIDQGSKIIGRLRGFGKVFSKFLSILKRGSRK